MRGKSKRSQRWTSAQPRGLGDTLSGFRRAPLVAVAAVVVFFVGVTVASAIVFGETKLAASDGAEGDRFGWSVAVAGERLAVGAVHDDNLNGTNAGAAYLYEPDGSGGWNETIKLTASDGEDGDWFGSAVAISGDRLVVGAEREGGAVGAAYVLEFDETEGWVEQAKLKASDASVGDQFGISVAISGDRIVVGARGHDDNGTDAGAAYVYEADGSGGWTQTQRLLASDLEAGWFGHSVAISGDRIVVGAYRSDLSPGAAYVYEPNGSGAWAETKIMASDGQDNDHFGISVAVSGDRIVVGADANHTNLEGNAGAAYIYEADGGGWTETAKLIESEEEASFFGHVVAVSGDRVVVGAPGDSPGQLNDRPGTAYVYDLDDAGDWTGVRLKPASEVELSDLYGRAVALSGDQVGDRIAVGAREDDDNGVAAGAVYVYDISGEPDPSNQPPSVDAGPEVSGGVGEAIPIQGTATDPDDDPLTISWTAETTACTFADAAALNTTVTCTEIGSHTLTLTASDSINDPVSDSTNAVIEDVTPPVLVMPDTISVEAPSPGGAIVEFVVTATDNVDPDPTVVCNPVSGSLFPIGDTTVTCTATDASGNSSSDTFLVTVSVGASTFDGFISQIESLDLANGTETSLVKKIEAAQRQFIDGDLEKTAETLQSLIDQVDAQEDKKLTSGEAAEIRTAAQALIEAIT